MKMIDNMIRLEKQRILLTIQSYILKVKQVLIMKYFKKIYNIDKYKHQKKYLIVKI